MLDITTFLQRSSSLMNHCETPRPQRRLSHGQTPTEGVIFRRLPGSRSFRAAASASAHVHIITRISHPYCTLRDSLSPVFKATLNHWYVSWVNSEQNATVAPEIQTGHSSKASKLLSFCLSNEQEIRCNQTAFLLNVFSFKCVIVHMETCYF